MIIAADIGNSTVNFGFFSEKKLIYKCSMASRNLTSDEYTMFIAQFMEHSNIACEDIDGAIIASVVPSLTQKIQTAIYNLFKVKALTVGHGIRIGLDIRTDRHAELGADIVANAVAASKILKKPFAVVDFGTATTLGAVNAQGELVGVVIMPGVTTAAEALAGSCEQLAGFSLQAPKSLLGKNTTDSMASGCVYGFASMIDGLLDRVSEQLGDGQVDVIACGGFAQVIVPHCKKKINVDPDLTLKGLAYIWEQNCPKNQKK